ncbi:hypothetical protein MMC11_007612 [Xylographa trunciseda]|nr:hypothetical protein [Xylographa trunciseda]
MAKTWLLSPFFVLLLGKSLLSRAQTTVPAPIVVPPSEYWEGDDGPWSTFQLRVGSPAQEVRLLASTASPVTWVVLDEVCSGQPDTSSCAEARGMTFNLNQSSTWKDQGIFDLYVEGNLNFTGNGEYGLDTVGLGLTSDIGPAVEGQVVAGIETTEFDFGILGLNVQPTNFTNFNNPVPSFFQTLVDQKLIPSLTWSYTAGNQYSLKKVLGSLIFGGYDSSRFTSNSLTFPFAPDSSRDIVVGVQSISSTETNGKTSELLTSGILTFIDSTVPYIYLPIDVCKQFENALGLIWDPSTELYLVSSSLHSSLLARGLNFTFTLGNTIAGGNTVQIVLPYAAFDLTATSPLINGTNSYFPLKRGNDTQYTLGRTFLQEAYLTVDYQRGNFSVSQCVFVDGAQSDIRIIHPIGYVAPSNDTSGSNGTSGADGSSTSSSSSTSFPTGAIAGVVIAVVVLALVVILLILAYRRRKWPFHNRKLAGAAELDSDAVGFEADGRMLPGKYPMGNMPAEAEADSTFNDSKIELDSQRIGPKNELPGAPVPSSRMMGTHGELHGSDPALEMEGSGFYHEMAGSPVPQEYYGNPKTVTELSRQNSRNTHTSSLRNEPVRRGSGPGARSPLSAAHESSQLGVPSPVSAGSASRDVSRLRNGTSRTFSEGSAGGTETTYLMSPVSAGSDSREASRSRGVEHGRGISPMRPGGMDMLASPTHEAVSREPSRTRMGDRGDGYHGP